MGHLGTRFDLQNEFIQRQLKTSITKTDTRVMEYVRQQHPIRKTILAQTEALRDSYRTSIRSPKEYV